MKADLLRRARQLAESGQRSVLATVVRREPPSSAHVGDSALITEAGEVYGWLGGACTKATIATEARAALEAGCPRLVLLTPEPEAIRRPGLRTLPMTCHSGGSVEIFVEPHLPPDRLMIFGQGEMVDSLVRIAAVLGIEASVVAADGRMVPLTRPPEFAVVATYGERDVEAILAALELGSGYLAVVAGARRFEALRESLVSRGVPSQRLDAIRTPAGLDIGARSPPEIALSILAEIVEFRRRSGGTGKLDSRGQPGEEVDHRWVDPVCGMSVAEGAPAATHEGRTHRFCCEACKDRFLSAPERFALSARASSP